MVIVDIQNTINSTQIPTAECFNNWFSQALKQTNATFRQAEITVRVVSRSESQQLNKTYREKDKPTNILSFPFEAPEMIPEEELDEYLGDLIVCEEVVINEAKAQNKKLEDHWAHMIVHGIFHLLGYDHIDDSEAEEMEALEIITLRKLGIDNPY